MFKKAKRYTENGRDYQITVKYGFDMELAHKHKQAAYFSITGSIDRIDASGRKIEEVSGGCIHDEIEEHFPEFAPLIRWHLTSIDGLPLHYSANAIFHAQMALSVTEYPHKYDPSPEKALGHFKSTVKFGAVEGDVLPPCLQDIEAIDHQVLTPKFARWLIAYMVKPWCSARLEALNRVFVADMLAFGILEIKPTA